MSLSDEDFWSVRPTLSAVLKSSTFYFLIFLVGVSIWLFGSLWGKIELDWMNCILKYINTVKILNLIKLLHSIWLKYLEVYFIRSFERYYKQKSTLKINDFKFTFISSQQLYLDKDFLWLKRFIDLSFYKQKFLKKIKQ